jgi:hypothetical protein
MPTTETRSWNELTIRGSAQEISHLLQRLERPQAPGWRRYDEAESRLRQSGLGSGNARCYACDADGRRPAAAMWLRTRGPETLYLEHVISLTKRDLSEDEKNLVMAEFESAILDPIREDLGVETEMIHHRVTLANYLLPEAIRWLDAFVSTANKASAYHGDCQCWQRFVVQAYLDGASFDPHLLEEWLAERGWPEDQGKALVGEYLAARTMLRTYDEERLDKCLP